MEPTKIKQISNTINSVGIKIIFCLIISDYPAGLMFQKVDLMSCGGKYLQPNESPLEDGETYKL